MVAAFVAFGLHAVINGPFSTIDRKHALRMLVFDAEHI